MSRCELCGEPMPKGEEMFKYHGYSSPCPNCAHCGHSLMNNSHGFDQNDGTMDGDKLVYSGRCTYCKECHRGAPSGQSEVTSAFDARADIPFDEWAHDMARRTANTFGLNDKGRWSIESSLQEAHKRGLLAAKEMAIAKVSDAFQRREPATGKWLTQFEVAREAIRALSDDSTGSTNAD